MFAANGGFASSAESNSASGALENDVEVHTEDTGEGVILDTQIDVFLDAESEAT